MTTPSRAHAQFKTPTPPKQRKTDKSLSSTSKGTFLKSPSAQSLIRHPVSPVSFSTPKSIISSLSCEEELVNVDDEDEKEVLFGSTSQADRSLSPIRKQEDSLLDEPVETGDSDVQLDLEETEKVDEIDLTQSEDYPEEDKSYGRNSSSKKRTNQKKTSTVAKDQQKTVKEKDTSLDRNQESNQKKTSTVGKDQQQTVKDNDKSKDGNEESKQKKTSTVAKDQKQTVKDNDKSKDGNEESKQKKTSTVGKEQQQTVKDSDKSKDGAKETKQKKTTEGPQSAGDKKGSKEDKAAENSFDGMVLHDEHPSFDAYKDMGLYESLQYHQVRLKTGYKSVAVTPGKGRKGRGRGRGKAVGRGTKRGSSSASVGRPRKKKAKAESESDEDYQFDDDDTNDDDVENQPPAKAKISADLPVTSRPRRSTKEIVAEEAAAYMEGRRKIEEGSDEDGESSSVAAATNKPSSIDFFVENKKNLDALKRIIRGPLEKMNQKEVAEHLSDYDRFPINTKSDSSAIFHAVAKQLPNYTGGKHLRKDVIDHMSDNRLKYEYLITNFLSRNYYDYCKEMRDTQILYDEVSILAIADFLNRNITIATSNDSWSAFPSAAFDIVVVMLAMNNVWSSGKDCSVTQRFNKKTTVLTYQYVRCWECKKKLPSHRALQQHKLQRHSKKTLQCPHCKKEYVNSDRLKQHIRVRHEGTLYKCKYQTCAKEFATRKHFDNHIKWHALQFKFTCELCGKGFMRKDHFKDHIMRHTKERKFQCEKCQFLFLRKNELRRHLERSCNSQPIPKVQCPVCGKKLKNADTLRNHRANVHEEGTLKKCPYCDDAQSFHASTIDRHIKRYHLDKIN